MARRALRKVDPALDLTGRLYTLEQLGRGRTQPPDELTSDFPQSFDAVKLFGRTAPLEVEMGSGKGLFISRAAAERPEHDFLGVEIARKYAAHCAAKMARAGLANAVMVSGDGLRLFREFLPASGVAAVHVYFPDPWWKKRHRKRRVMNESFLSDIERVLIPGGILHFWTDVEEYFQSTLELMAQVSKNLEGPLPVAERQAEHDLDYRTHFERRKRQDALPIHRAEFRRKP